MRKTHTVTLLKKTHTVTKNTTQDDILLKTPQITDSISQLLFPELVTKNA